MNDPHERKRLISRLSKMLDIGRGCLCGHFESCENCSSGSSLNEVRNEIKGLIEEIKHEHGVVGKELNFFGKASLINNAKAKIALDKLLERR